MFNIVFELSLILGSLIISGKEILIRLNKFKHLIFRIILMRCKKK